MDSFINQIDPNNHKDLPSSVMHASHITCRHRHLPSSISCLNDFLEGGLPWGSLSEWGSPLGSGGREIILSFLTCMAERQDSHWGLWVQKVHEAKVYPPAWEARGVDLKYMRFAQAENPIRDLKALFLDPFFKVIVLDSPQQLSTDDCNFLKKQAQKHQQVIILIRHYFLSPKRGNVWARLRLNCWYDHIHDQFHLRVVKGLSPREVAIDFKQTIPRDSQE